MLELGNNKLYLGDCLEIMPKLVEQGIKVDAIIADIPYGTTACKWDTIIPFDKMWELLKKIRKDNTPIVLFGSEPFSSYLRLSNIKEYKYDWIWNKVRGSNFIFANKQPLKIIENIIVFYKKQCVYNAQKINNPNGISTRHLGKMCNTSKISLELMNNRPKMKYSSNYEPDKLLPKQIITFKNFYKDKFHPTQKPVALMEYLIKTYTNENDIVLDFTMGSGTTGVACMNTNRKFIGIELDEKYFNIACDRIRNATRQLRLF